MIAPVNVVVTDIGPRFAQVKFALVRFALVKFTPRTEALLNFVCCRSNPVRSAPEMFASVRSAFLPIR